MGRYFTSGPWIFHGSSSMLAGSVMGVPGPVATMRPPWTCRLSSAVGGRYSPTLVRSSPSSGEINTRSPTTIRRLGVSSSRMGNSIRPRGKAVSPVCDADHRRRLTRRRRSLSMCPGRSGRGRFLAALLMSWWDAVRMAWFYWFGLARFLLVFVGWIWGLLRLGVGLLWRTLKNLVTSPFAMLDSSSRQPGVPWIAFMLLLFWSAIEATIFTFTLRPTMSEMLS